MEEAERIAINEHNSDKILVISGVGKRLCSAGYYTHLFIFFLILFRTNAFLGGLNDFFVIY
jgi:mannitol/fructose-specific phosphotransferase system IIA component